MLLALFLVSAGASFMVGLNPPQHWLPHPRSLAENPPDDLFGARTEFAVDPALTGGRLIYPYSLIPGGARSLQELREEIARDPVVAAQYSDFDLARVHVTRADSDRLMYVAYRVGNAVYWTRKTLRIPQGETLLTDGVHYARTRCGNPITEKPHAPQERVEAYEVPPSALETPLPLRVPDLGPPTEPPSVANLEGPTPPPPVLAGPAAPPPFGGVTIIPPGPGPGGVHVGLPPTGGVILPKPPGVPPKRKHQKKPAPPPVPEPGTVALVASGLGWLAYRKKSKCQL